MRGIAYGLLFSTICWVMILSVGLLLAWLGR